MTKMCKKGVYDRNRIPYVIGPRLTCFAEPAFDATISCGLSFEPEAY